MSWTWAAGTPSIEVTNVAPGETGAGRAAARGDADDHEPLLDADGLEVELLELVDPLDRGA